MMRDNEYIRIEFGSAFDDIMNEENFYELLKSRINPEDNSVYSKILQIIAEYPIDKGTMVTEENINVNVSITPKKNTLTYFGCGSCTIFPNTNGFLAYLEIGTPYCNICY